MESTVVKLKLGRFLDEKPVRLTVDLPAQVHRDLVAYAAALGREAASDVPVEAVKLVAPMLARFMAAERGFAAARRAGPTSAENSARPHGQAFPGEHGMNS